ncbi:hypothetical protein AB0F57_11465 [Streptomyces tanashiensis]|uniref:hypothetical protein n=1 Tax=Streptomyces tanashiensis TaxID=67367 RepID=UPI00340A91E3
MRGDENQSALAKEGPRHAAPRKSLLNRIQGPAGKAMALAAMPTAVFVGMGLTPKLALADDKDVPFAPGPCVTRSDEPTPEATETAKPEESAKPTATATVRPTDTPSATATPSAPATPSATPTPTATATGQTAAQQTREQAQNAPAPAATPTATASPTKSTNPLDPLGVGDALKDLFDGPDKEPTATPTTAAPTTSVPQQTAAPAEKPTADAPAPTATASSKPKPAADPDDEGTRTAIEKAAAKAGAEVEELPESAKGLDVKQDTDIPDGAKPRFPCPELDEQALADADLEQGIPLLPDEPWRLESSWLTLHGLKYHGIVEVKTGSGKIKKVLKFTASSVGIKDLHQLTEHSDGLTGHVRSDKGTTSTITGGTVTMYTEELKGNLLGIIPITFGPESPPPLNIPEVFFTNVKLKQAGQFGGTLKVKGLRNTIEPS